MYVASATHFSCAIRHRDIAEVKKMEKMVSRRLEPSSNILFIVKLIRGGGVPHYTNLDIALNIVAKECFII